ncbi:hypothetical protein EW145_g3654 [Phellinidium pouzarii]|uniref:DUF7137 domain-containing protein n=1 Tax=Phellinidium pouzarii TaxID=167371 RepID=A0A4S4L6T6_9AGAM|nr:hypothetical protein EW145_g3654 [Phellinidium pouzarii]
MPQDSDSEQLNAGNSSEGSLLLLLRNRKSSENGGDEADLLSTDLTALLTSAVHDEHPVYSLSAIHHAVTISGVAYSLDALHVIPLLIDSTNPTANDILALLGECGNAKEVVISVQESLERMLHDLLGSEECESSKIYIALERALLLYIGDLDPDVIAPLIFSLSPLTCTSPDSQIRLIAFRILGALLMRAPPLEHMSLLQELLSCNALPALRVAAVGLLKDAVLASLNASAPAPSAPTSRSPFASPALLRTFGYVVLRPDPTDLFSRPADQASLNAFLDTSEPKRLVECLSFYYVLLMRDTANFTGVREPGQIKSVEKELISPLRNEHAVMALAALETSLERVDDAYKMLNEARAPSLESMSSTTASNTGSFVSIPATAAAGGLTFTQPPQTADASFYKIASNNPITFGWNFTSLIVTPSALTVSAICENGNTYPVGPTDGVIAGTATSVVWDPFEYNQANPNLPLAVATYTLSMWDQRGPGARPTGGFFSPNSNLRFALYSPVPYTPLASGWTCPGCSAAEATFASHPALVAFFATFAIMLLSGWNLLRRAYVVVLNVEPAGKAAYKDDKLPSLLPRPAPIGYTVEIDMDLEKQPSVEGDDLKLEQERSYDLVRAHKVGLGKLTRRLLTWGVEARGIYPVPRESRTDQHFHKIFFIWFAANFNILSVSTGTTGPIVYGLSLRDSCLLILFFNVLCCTPPAYLATWGPKLGLRQMCQSRYSFGVGIVIIAVISLMISFSGYKVINWYERISWIPVLVVFLVALGVGGKNLSNPPPTEHVTAVSALSFASVIAGFVITFSPLSSDYTTYMDSNVSSWIIFTYSYLGFFIPIVTCQCLGAALGAAIPLVPSWNAAYSEQSIGNLFATILAPTHGFGKFLTVLLSLSVTANIAPTMYSFGLTFQVFLPICAHLPRYLFSVLATAVVIPLSIVGAHRFYSTLTNFLGLIGYWASCFIAVVVTEHFVFRKHARSLVPRGVVSPEKSSGFPQDAQLPQKYSLDPFENYDISTWNTARGLPSGCAAVGASVLSFALVVPSMDQVWFVGPIARTTGDIGFEVALVLTAVLYVPLRYAEFDKHLIANISSEQRHVYDLNPVADFDA